MEALQVKSEERAGAESEESIAPTCYMSLTSCDKPEKRE
jgi:hypothetical protein